MNTLYNINIINIINIMNIINTKFNIINIITYAEEYHHFYSSNVLNISPSSYYL